MAQPDPIPLELLDTFVCIANHDGSAAEAALELGISQPTISKRLTALRRATSDLDRQPWLLLSGKRWKLTSEGQRVRDVVSDLIRRYRQAQQFIEGERSSRPVVSMACGQQAATGFVKTAIERFLREHPEYRVRLSTPRGKSRIEGVAGGQFDLAVVTDSPATIHRVARRELYVETLFEDQFVLVANPAAKSGWGKQWNGLPTDRAVTAPELRGLPFVLPEPDSSRRQQFDEWYHRGTGEFADVALEIGGWKTILEFAMSGSGVGFVSISSVELFDRSQRSKLSYRRLDAKQFPPDAVRLIARKVHSQHAPDIGETALGLLEMLRANDLAAP